ncbi:MAG: ParB N-terminal domain-containing protein [Candidatus Paceibacterota bacterium]|jgi:hypothetical protein
MVIKESWENSPLYKEGKVELVPTEWVWKYWGRDVSPKTTLVDGTEVDLSALWKNIYEEGLHEPLVIRVGVKNKKFRLEAGNHRIQVLHDNNVEMIPVTVQVQDECGPHVSNVMTDATHNFDYEDNLVSNTDQEYMKPSEVFRIPLN